MADNLWGPIDVARWRELPHLAGRLASEDDVKAGRAVFCQQGQGVRMEPYPTELPRPAILKLEAAEEPVIMIQAEHAAHQIIVGYRNLAGGNGIATLQEMTLLDAPDSRFVELRTVLHNKGMQLTRPGQLRSLAADPQCCAGTLVSEEERHR